METSVMRLLFVLAVLLTTAAARGDGPADLDRDGDVDLADFSLLQRCYSGNGVAQPAQACQVCRLTPDVAVDFADFLAWRNCFNGPDMTVAPGCTPQGMQYFPRESAWYQDISFWPADTQSAAVIQWLTAAGGWGLGRLQIDFSIEVLEADASTPLLPFIKTDDWYYPDCDFAPVPVPAGGALEGEAGYACESDGDCHLIVVYPPTAKLYEMWRANIVNGTFYGGCLAVWDMNRVYAPSGRGDNCTSADAAGYPIAPLLFSADEVQAGWIDHAIRFILPNSRIRNGVYVHPATHSTGATSGGSSAPPYGARLRLRADYPVDALPSAGARVVARAMQRYGILLADGGSVALTAQSDRFTTTKWAGLLGSRDLQAIQVSDFVMVDAGARLPYTGDCVRTPLATKLARGALAEARRVADWGRRWLDEALAPAVE
jgi:hypothetical protein